MIRREGGVKIVLVSSIIYLDLGSFATRNSSRFCIDHVHCYIPFGSSMSKYLIVEFASWIKTHFMHAHG